MSNEPKALDIEQVEAFLSELAELTNRTGVAIAGCGCCGSPFLYPARKHAEYEIEPARDGGFDRLTFTDSEQ